MLDKESHPILLTQELSGWALSAGATAQASHRSFRQYQSDYEERHYLSYVRTHLSSEGAKAFIDCMKGKASQYGVHAWVKEEKPERILFALRWTPPPSRPEPESIIYTIWVDKKETLSKTTTLRVNQEEEIQVDRPSAAEVEIHFKAQDYRDTKYEQRVFVAGPPSYRSCTYPFDSSAHGNGSRLRFYCEFFGTEAKQALIVVNGTYTFEGSGSKDARLHLEVGDTAKGSQATHGYDSAAFDFETVVPVGPGGLVEATLVFNHCYGICRLRAQPEST